MTQCWILVFARLRSCESISRRRRFHSDKKNRKIVTGSHWSTFAKRLVKRHCYMLLPKENHI